MRVALLIKRKQHRGRVRFVANCMLIFGLMFASKVKVKASKWRHRIRCSGIGGGATLLRAGFSLFYFLVVYVGFFRFWCHVYRVAWSGRR